MELAPIVVLTYSRIHHLEETIKSLQGNTLAKNSELYLFLDAPKKGDEKAVETVKQYLYTIDGFKKVTVIEREKNNRVDNYEDGVKLVLKRFGKMIFLEDDNVVSPYFLQYMNDGLEYYKYNKKVLAICGYNVPAKFPVNFDMEFYASYFFNAWGFAIWADREHLISENHDGAYGELLQNKKLYKKVKSIHPKLIQGLKDIQNGILNAGDYKLTFHCIKNDIYVIKPMQSYVDNIGHDGSGLHCRRSDKFRNDIEDVKKIVHFTSAVNYYPEMDDVVYDYSHGGGFFYKTTYKINCFIKYLLGN